MGYTHYWKGSTKCSILTRAQIIDEIGRVVKASRHIPLADGSGEKGTRPTFSQERIDFNGVDESSHETFRVELNKDTESEFCKTAQKPYDILVCACLIILDHYIPTFKVSSDGDESDWQPAVELCRGVLGYGVYPCRGDDPKPESQQEAVPVKFQRAIPDELRVKEGLCESKREEENSSPMK